MRHRNLDHHNRKQRRIRIILRICPRAATKLLLLPNRGRTRNIDIEVVLILRIDQQRVRVRSTARLHIGHLLRIRDIADIEDAYATEAVGAWRWWRRTAICRRRRACRRRRRGRSQRVVGCRGSRFDISRRQRNPLRPAVRPPIIRFNRHNQQMPIYRHIPLPTRANHRRNQLDLRRIRDVVEVHPVVVPHKQVVPTERQIRVRRPIWTWPRRRPRSRCRARCRRSRSRSSLIRRNQLRIRSKPGRLRQRHQQLQTHVRDTRVIQPRFQPHTRIVRTRPRIHIHRRRRRSRTCWSSLRETGNRKRQPTRGCHGHAARKRKT